MFCRSNIGDSNNSWEPTATASGRHQALTSFICAAKWPSERYWATGGDGSVMPSKQRVVGRPHSDPADDRPRMATTYHELGMTAKHAGG
jgi:hypothetical protein